MNEPVRYGAWIDGAHVVEQASFREAIDPATGEAWAMVADGTPATVEQAVASACRAFRDSAWARLSADERAQLLHRFAGLLRERAAELAPLESHDNGKPLWQARDEVVAMADWCAYYAGLAGESGGRSFELSSSRRGLTINRPVGVVAALTPYNSPVSAGCWKIAPALAAGNTVVVKPSPDAPVAPFALARLATEAGFPDGVVNAVIGDVAVGKALVEHPDVALVSFTGSTGVGRQIAASAARTLKRVVIEAGGKSPYIVFADAALDEAVSSAAAAIFGAAGQSCIAPSRMLVQREVYDGFVERLCAIADDLRVGDPFDEATMIGPLVSARQRERVAGFVDRARAEGVTIAAGGAPPDDERLARGCFYRPTVVTNADNALEISQEEIFGPVGVVLPFDGEDEALQIANDSAYGLAAGLWTSDLSRAERLAGRLEVGSVWINCYRAFHWQLPFGGVKQSGYGRESGREAFEEMTAVQAQALEYGPPGADLGRWADATNGPLAAAALAARG
ncbi:MAG: aldehyde dehydrogenase family protein [Actinobacteria bacterium]|nr:aldehyde dehydrogenase family protein [Actinomycetota bacterium]